MATRDHTVDGDEITPRHRTLTPSVGSRGQGRVASDPAVLVDKGTGRAVLFKIAPEKSTI
jgi:hypothetical protein